MSREEYESGRIQYVQQDGNREFISLLACVCADGSALPPALIYQGTSGDLQNSWVEDLKEEDEALFTSAANGWTSNALGRAWLKRFHKQTRQKGSRWRLLIADGHISHVNLPFVQLADSYRILLIIFPSHTTHRLQPLDVVLFGPLSTAYSKELVKYTETALGWVTMTKRMFWPLFREAWKASFTVKNIKKAFEATGIWPQDPQKVLQKLPTPTQTLSTSLPSANQILHTPYTSRQGRQLAAATPNLAVVAALQNAVIKLSTLSEIHEHRLNGLSRSFAKEKQKRKPRKRLNLVGEEDHGEAQFFSPTRILAAIEHADSEEAQKEEEARQKEAQKAERERVRVQKLAEKEEARIHKAAERQLAKEQREAAAGERRARIEQNKQDRALRSHKKAIAAYQRKLEQKRRKDAAAVTAAERAAKKAEKAVSNGSKKAPQKPANPLKKAAVQLAASTGTSGPEKATSEDLPDAAVDVASDPPAPRSRSGRRVQKPTRFQD